GTRNIHRQIGTMQLLIGHQAVEAALQFANVVLYASRDVGDDIVGYMIMQQVGLDAQNRHTRLQIRWLDIRDQAPLEAGTQTLLQAHNSLGGSITTDHNLLAHLIEAIKSMEELFLG